MAQLSISDKDNVYNWLADFIQERSHCGKYCDEMSDFLSTTASIIQGSAVGPASYVVNAGDLTSIMSGNQPYKVRRRHKRCGSSRQNFA